MVFDTIKTIFNNEGIQRIGMLNINDCDIINARILPDWAKSVVMFCIPYRSSTTFSNDGFSEYARIYDYHKFSSELYERITALLEESTGYQFKGFCDHSPINEKLAIAKCGLGVIGRNSLFIDDTYGSFVFLGSLITDIECEFVTSDIKLCENCGLCVSICPNSAIVDKGIDRNLCLSGISQKKSKNTQERELLKKNNIVWGCDICQNVCPRNKSALISPIQHFKNTRIEHINREFIESLSDEEFNKYAFSYKGRKIVLNNIEFI